jgi:hypothetical protein
VGCSLQRWSSTVSIQPSHLPTRYQLGDTFIFQFWGSLMKDCARDLLAARRERAAHVAAWREGGMSQVSYARLHGLHPTTFNGWIGATRTRLGLSAVHDVAAAATATINNGVRHHFCSRLFAGTEANLAPRRRRRAPASSHTTNHLDRAATGASRGRLAERATASAKSNSTAKRARDGTLSDASPRSKSKSLTTCSTP